MKHLGDITKIDGRTAPVVDCIIGGSPCQDLSVAGRREGLAGARSGLFMEQIRLVKEMRDEDRKRGRTGHAIRPRYMVWENVPGAFSSNKGQDFKAVLEEVIRVAEPQAPDIPLPPKGKWPLADAYMGDGWSVAYRVFDAQFWGVPQRRRRICLVADFGGHTAPEILFVRESLCGDTEESGEAREAAAGDTGPGAGEAIALRMRAGCDGGGKGALIQVDKSGTLGCSNDQTIFCMATGQAGAEITEDKSPTLNCDHEQPILVLNDQGGSVMEVSVEKTGTLRAQEHGHQPLVFDARGNGDGKVAPTMTGDHESRVTDYSAVVMSFNPGQSERAQGLGIAEEQAPTLGAEMHPPAVMVAETVTYPENVAHALRARGQMAFRGDQDTLIMQPGAPAAVDCRNGTLNPEVNGTLQAKKSGGQSLNLNNVVIAPAPDGEQPSAEEGAECLTPWDVQSRRVYPAGGTWPALYAGEGGGHGYVMQDPPTSFDFAQVTSKTNQSKGSKDVAYSLAATGRPGVVENMVVRRLTPMECERLQGYPDGWTDIGPWVDSKGKLHKESSDSARYKACGNSIALPPWKWVLKRLCALGYERDATLASLFDGIGGFPLIWESINGKGSCLWASEIEEFPIAVTKIRFGED